MIKLTFIQLFRSKFLESKSIIAKKSIKMNLDLIGKFKIDWKSLNRDWNRSKMIEKVKIYKKILNILTFLSFNWYFGTFNWSFFNLTLIKRSNLHRKRSTFIKILIINSNLSLESDLHGNWRSHLDSLQSELLMIWFWTPNILSSP